MSDIQDLLSNRTIVVPALSWLIAQIIKVIVVIVKEGKMDFSRFVGSGGMPSSHSSLIVSLATVVGKNQGFDSTLFGVTLAVALIVMYDAAGVRRAAGKQAKILNKLIFTHNDRLHIDEKLKELVGHTPVEVLAGALLGMVIGMWLG